VARTVGEIAKALDGAVEGDAAAVVTGLNGLQEAGRGDITFLANPKYAAAVETTGATAVIVGADWSGRCPCAVVRVKNPDRAFAQAAALLGPKPVAFAPGVHPTAVVAADAVLGEGASIGPHCVLEAGVGIGKRTVLVAGCYLGHGTKVGDDCRFYPNVSTREGTVIGNRTILHNGVVVGSDGFGYNMEKGAWTKIPQIGTVQIGDDVEVGANVTIDRARFGKTVIGNGVKIDNLVQIAHNVRIGDHTAMAAQVGISGSTSVGKRVRIGGQAGLTGHVHVGDDCVIGAQAGVTKDIPPGIPVWGTPAIPMLDAKKLNASA
jgi:UDP-3-O-[3-hydroxymyristoyl] glucosamine N-acyltransferase